MASTASAPLGASEVAALACAIGVEDASEDGLSWLSCDVDSTLSLSSCWTLCTGVDEATGLRGHSAGPSRMRLDNYY